MLKHFRHRLVTNYSVRRDLTEQNSKTAMPSSDCVSKEEKRVGVARYQPKEESCSCAGLLLVPNPFPPAYVYASNTCLRTRRERRWFCSCSWGTVDATRSIPNGQR